MNFQFHKALSLSNLRSRLHQLMVTYEEFIGIRQVKEAQENVLKTELTFKRCQEERRAAQERLAHVQTSLRSLRQDIDRTARGDTRYLDLIKQEIDIIREERELRGNFERLEEKERERFAELSNALRSSHERERAQGEKTKYWSVMGSVIGAFFGILGTSINARLRHNQTKDILLQTTNHVKQIEESVENLKLGFFTARMEGEGQGHEQVGNGAIVGSKDTEKFEGQLANLSGLIKRLEAVADLQGNLVLHMSTGAGRDGPSIAELSEKERLIEKESLGIAAAIFVILALVYSRF